MDSKDADVRRLFEAAELFRKGCDLESYIAAYRLVGPEAFKGLLVATWVSTFSSDPRLRQVEQGFAERSAHDIFEGMEELRDAALIAAN